MAYVEYTGTCDICGKSNLYVKYYYNHDSEGNIIDGRMECIDCSDARKHKWAVENYGSGGKQYLDFLERDKDKIVEIRKEIEAETKRILKRRKERFESIFGSRNV